MLRARLYEHELQKREAAAQAEADSKTDIGWGHQIRSYVLQPYQMVKDLRTAVEKGNAQGVLDGDIDDFLEASLPSRLDRTVDRAAEAWDARGWGQPVGGAVWGQRAHDGGSGRAAGAPVGARITPRERHGNV